VIVIRTAHHLGEVADFYRLRRRHVLGLLCHFIDERFEGDNREDDTDERRSLSALARLGPNVTDRIDRNTEQRARFEHSRWTVCDVRLGHISGQFSVEKYSNTA
jgi:hypothetical protein